MVSSGDAEASATGLAPLATHTMVRSRTAVNHMPRYHGSGAGAGAAVPSASGA
jgi:hypothetical protein